MLIKKTVFLTKLSEYYNITKRHKEDEINA